MRATPAPACSACRTLRRGPSSWAAAYRLHCSPTQAPPPPLSQPHPKIVSPLPDPAQTHLPFPPFNPSLPSVRPLLLPGLHGPPVPTVTSIQTATPQRWPHTSSTASAVSVRGAASSATHQSNKGFKDTPPVRLTLLPFIRLSETQLSARECYHTISHCLFFCASREMRSTYEISPTLHTHTDTLAHTHPSVPLRGPVRQNRPEGPAH